VTGHGGGPERVRFAASDPEAAREFIDRAYGGKLQVDGLTSAGRVTLDRRGGDERAV
jgi:hypothetical protein